MPRRVVCAECGRSPSEAPLRRVYPNWVPYPDLCEECYGAPSGIAPGTGGLPYPDWDDLPEVGRE